MPDHIIIHAPNVHSGGGYSLLINLLQAIPPENSCLLFLDERMRVSESVKKQHQIIWVKPSILGRLRSEWLLKLRARNTLILSFGNLPPLFSRSSKVILFIQNRYLITKRPLKDFAFKARVRIALERLWISFCVAPQLTLVVQTQSMKIDVLKHPILSRNKVHVLPFIGFEKPASKKEKTTPKDQAIFIYPASGDPHKNHKNLVLAWCELAQKGVYPLLQLTLSEGADNALVGWIELQAKKFNLKIDNLGVISDQTVNDHLSLADALIYPSLFESFGIPLVIAESIGTPILASELDYVRDLVNPSQTFDPGSPISISRAILRFMNRPDHRLPAFSSAEFFQFIRKI